LELEAGMYVRTKEGYICKILKLNEPYQDDGYLDFNDIGSPKIQEKNVVKASYNIIDLIEVGDYVNGNCVDRAKYRYAGKNFIDFEDDVNADSGYVNALLEEDIKTIVTKEQFNAMKYEVGDDR